MIGVGIITYDREDQFQQIVKSVKLVDHVVVVKDGGKAAYKKVPNVDFFAMKENKGVGFCKNVAIQELLKRGCEHIFIIEDDCLITDPAVWDYCISFAQESGLLHFNWNDYRHSRFATAQFDKHKAALCHNTEANFSYFHRDFLAEIRFDTTFHNAWEHIDLEIQGEAKGFLPPFRIFVSPSDLRNYLKLIDGGESTITNKGNYQQDVIDGHHTIREKWGKSINEFIPVNIETFYERMKEITIKYANRT